MDDSPSTPRPPGRAADPAVRPAPGPDARPAAFAYHWVRLQCRDGAPRLAVAGPGGTLKPTAQGRKVAACWRALAALRPHLLPDALALRPDAVEGLLAVVHPDGPADAAATLAEAVRLFKAASARALATAPADMAAREAARGAKRGGAAGRAGTGAARRTRGAGIGADGSASAGKASTPGPWKRGFAERPLADASEVAAARAALDGARV